MRFEKICARDIRAIYFGHGAPLLTDCNIRLRRSLEIIRKGARRPDDSFHTKGKVHCEVV
jgi:hypothetical protein